MVKGKYVCSLLSLGLCSALFVLFVSSKLMSGSGAEGSYFGKDVVRGELLAGKAFVPRVLPSVECNEKRFASHEREGIINFSVPQVGFSLDLSTEDNYRTDEINYHGKYAEIRATLDYSFHSHYTKCRQLLQNKIVDRLMNETAVIDKNGDTCESPKDPWIVFTAGPMGSGKSHTIRYLASEGKFPLHSFVWVDPDDVRHHLPEFDMYIQYDPFGAGEMTRKEAGFVAELLTQAALREGRNVLVDGSLRDWEWYKLYFLKLRRDFPHLRIAIIHVTAPRDAIYERIQNRSLQTGRVVPRETVEHAIEQVPRSVNILRPLCDFFCEVHNPPGSTPVVLVTQGVSWDSFHEKWQQTCPSRPHSIVGKKASDKEGSKLDIKQ